MDPAGAAQLDGAGQPAVLALSGLAASAGLVSRGFFLLIESNAKPLAVLQQVARIALSAHWRANHGRIRSGLSSRPDHRTGGSE